MNDSNRIDNILRRLIDQYGYLYGVVVSASLRHVTFPRLP
eukprot:COSAG06_NODE_65016_length_258_cov_0.635220_2_plen_39_part_01